MNIKSLALMAVAALLLIGCQEQTGIQLRIENASDFRFDEVLVNNVSYGALDANEVSAYLDFEYIYTKEYVKVVIGSRVIELIPEDFRKEDYHNDGSYKYVIDILHSKWIDLTFQPE